MSPELEDALKDLIDRMETAEVRLIDMVRDHGPRTLEGARLESKANGVRLATGYVREELQRRAAHTAPQPALSLSGPLGVVGSADSSTESGERL